MHRTLAGSGSGSKCPAMPRPKQCIDMLAKIDKKFLKSASVPIEMSGAKGLGLNS